jgi:TetR/AcrR family tetracycline transcriptional repressor
MRERDGRRERDRRHRHRRPGSHHRLHAPETVDDRRREIVRAALDLLDEEGFDGSSLRLLARRLGMHAPGLYWYFESKQDLIDLMAKEILAQGMSNLSGLMPGQTWDDWLVELACMVRRALLTRRDGARVVAGAFLLRNEAITPVVELSLEILEASGFEPLAALGCTMTLVRYATGIALDEQLSPLGTPRDAETMRNMADLVLPSIDADRWPRTADAYQKVFRGRQLDRDVMFRWGAQMIVRGMTDLRRA